MTANGWRHSSISSSHARRNIARLRKTARDVLDVDVAAVAAVAAVADVVVTVAVDAIANGAATDVDAVGNATVDVVTALLLMMP